MKEDVDVPDLIAKGLLGLSFVVTGVVIGGVTGVVIGVFGSGDIIEWFKENELTNRIAGATAKDDAIARSRFNDVCNTGFLADGFPIISTKAVAVDIRTQRSLKPGTVLCDGTGATAILDKDGIASDIRVSAKVKRMYHDQGFHEQNEAILREKKLQEK